MYHYQVSMSTKAILEYIYKFCLHNKLFQQTNKKKKATNSIKLQFMYENLKVMIQERMYDKGRNVNLKLCMKFTKFLFFFVGGEIQCCTESAICDINCV